MNYLTCQEVALKLNISSRRIQQLCKDSLIPNAKKEKGIWLIPESYLHNNYSFDNNYKKEKKKPLPVGISNFKRAVDEYYYVDKTILIKDLIDLKPQVALFTRPRRFGKTLNMDMLKLFFEKTKEDNSRYFKNLLIWKEGKEYQNHQGKYPVIYLTLKDIKCDLWSSTSEKIKNIIKDEFNRHDEIETSDNITIYEKNKYISILNGKATDVEYEESLYLLSKLLFKHYNEKCIIIIDEYDTPITEGYLKGFYDKIITFMRNFFSSGLKDNPYISFSILTGILRIAKESIFNWLNNVDIFSILDDDFSSYFGFTKEEIVKMLDYYKMNEKYDEIIEWYDGYLFGNNDILNPWSVVSYLSRKCKPFPYWSETSSNDIINELLENSNDDINKKLYELLKGNSVLSIIDTNTIYKDIKNNPDNIFSFLVLTGYLKAKIINNSIAEDLYELKIPNKEVKTIYKNEILSKISNKSLCASIYQAINLNHIEEIEQNLNRFLVETVSYYDTTNENFYHGLMLGLLSLFNNEYEINSNKESGYGRFDIILIPKNINYRGFVLELKCAANENELETKAIEALNQIKEKKYDSLLKEKGVALISHIGISFYKKKALIKWQ